MCHNWKVGKPDLAMTGEDTITASKRKKPRQLINVSMLRDTSRRVDETVFEDEVEVPERMVGDIFEDDEATPKRLEQAAKSELWRELMYNEQNALKNRGCWRAVDTPDGVRLIEYMIKRDWAGKIAKRKSVEERR